MEQTSTAQTEETPTGNRELIRPLQGRMIAGVAQGLANRFDIPVGLLRFLFVLTAFFGGLGVLLYAAGWILIRSEDETEAPVEGFFAEPSTARTWIAIGLIFWAALIILGNLTFLRGEFVWGVGLLVVGVLLYTGHIPLGERRSAKTDAEPDERQGAAVVTETPPVETDAQPPTGGSSPPPPKPTPAAPARPPVPHKPRPRSMLGRITIGFALLAMGALALLDNIPAVPIDAGPRHYLALVVTVLGLGLLVGSIAGRARWLILIALLLIPPLLISPVFDFDFRTETFSQNIRPTDFDQLDNFYSIELGDLEIDLTQLPWDGRTIELTARVDVGDLTIVVPDDVAVIGFADADIGRISVLGRDFSGIGLSSFEFTEPGSRGTIRLEASVDVGNVEIKR